MRKLISIIFFVLLIQVTASPQPCLQEGITFSSQAEIDNFQTNYPNCTQIEGNVEISADDITDLSSLGVLTSIGGYLFIRRTVNLTTLSGLENLTSIGEYLYLSNNVALTSVLGLVNLTSIGGSLYIEDHLALTSLSGLGSVSSIGGDINIEVTFLLTNLTGLENIPSGSIENLSITDNYSLANCEVENICEYLSSPNGTIDIHDNAPGCNSQEEVELACGMSIDENRRLTSLHIYPNPFAYSVTIEYELFHPETVMITFYNQFGKQVEVIEENQQMGLNKVVWAPKNLADGIYYFKIQAGEQVVPGMVVLLR